MHKDKLFAAFFTDKNQPSIHIFAPSVQDAFAIALTYGNVKSFYEEEYVTENKPGQ